MVQQDVVTQQLRRIGANFRFWNRPELNELPKILFDAEQIMHVVNGRYEGGFAMLVATDIRVLLIDKKPLFLTLEDIRYDRITDVQLNHRLLDATLRLGSLSKDQTFTGYNPSKMREMTSYIQERVMISRRARQGGGAMQAPSLSQVPDEPSLQPLANEVDQPAVFQARPIHSTQVAAAATPAPTTHAQVTEAQTEVLGQVAVMAQDEMAMSLDYEQLMNVMTLGVATVDDTALHPGINPYRTPLAFRRRVSRFY